MARMSEARRLQKLIVKGAAQAPAGCCSLCGQAFAHGAPTYAGPARGKRQNTGDCCAQRLTSIDAGGIYLDPARVGSVSAAELEALLASHPLQGR